MLATLPVDAVPLACDLKPYTMVLYADEARKRPVSLPEGPSLRRCAAAADGAQVLTRPDSGGTDMCIFYEMGVDPKNPQLQTRRQKAGVAKSLPDKSCPPIDPSQANYPGKAWFFLFDNVVLPNAYKIKAKVESEGLAFLKAESAPLQGKRPAREYRDAPLGLYAVSSTRAIECRKNADFFQGRYAACYRAEVYNPHVRGDRTLIVALTKNGEYKFIESVRTGAAAPQ